MQCAQTLLQVAFPPFSYDLAIFDIFAANFYAQTYNQNNEKHGSDFIYFRYTTQTCRRGKIKCILPLLFNFRSYSMYIIVNLRRKLREKAMFDRTIIRHYFFYREQSYYLTWKDMSSQAGILNVFSSKKLWTAPSKEQYLPAYFKGICDKYMESEGAHRVLPVQVSMNIYLSMIFVLEFRL